MSAIMSGFISRHVFKTRPNSARVLLALPVTYFPIRNRFLKNINKQLCWLNLATVVAGLMKSKLTESKHIDICKPINLLNKKLGDKNPPDRPHNSG